MTVRPKVFVTQERPGTDYSQAAEKGDIIFLSTKEYLPQPTSGVQNEEVIRGMKRKLADYIPGIDYILCHGSPQSMLITGMIVGRNPSATHTVLKWDNRRNNYSLTTITA